VTGRPVEVPFPDRLAKRRALEQAGISPHALRFDRTALSSDIKEAHAQLPPGEASGSTESVAGRVMLRRDQGRLAFVVIEDPGGRIQLFCSEAEMPAAAKLVLEQLDLGDWVGATGEVMRTKRGELSIRVNALSMLAKSLRPLPDKWHGLADVETRFRERDLDLAVNESARQIMRIRIEALAGIRAELARRGYLEVETPILQTLYGGATARPFVTHHNVFDIDLYLRIAPELYLKRLLVGGVEKVFEVARNFRNEGVGTRYNPEFTIIEAYQAFADYHDMIELVEAIVTAAGASGAIAPPWPRARLTDLLSDVAELEMPLDLEVEELRRRAERAGVSIDAGWGPGKIVLEAYEKLVEPGIEGPLVVMDYPREVSPLARAHRDDPRLAERFEVVVRGRELCNAYSELTDPLEQRELFEQQARLRVGGDEEAMILDEEYLRALEHGLPPCGGLGLGFDRLVMLLAGVDTIREVILFPLLRPEG
jgi:lysyl-tRNA synthetase, class II